MKKIIFAVVTFLIMLYFISLLLWSFKGDGNKNAQDKTIHQQQTDNKEKQNDIEEVKIEIPEYRVTRSLAAKMGALAFYAFGELEAMDINIQYEDCSETDWYYFFVNAAATFKWLTIEESKFKPYEPLTKAEAYTFFTELGKQGETIDLDKYNYFNGKGEITSDQFMDVFMDLLTVNSKKTTLKSKELVVFALDEGDERLGNFDVATDQGLYHYGGLNLKRYKDKKVRFLINGNQIVGLLNKGINEYELKNVYITNKTGENFSVFLGGATRILLGKVHDRVAKGLLCDLTFSDGKVTNMVLRVKIIRGVIKRVNENYIELDTGKYTISEDFKVYSDINDQLRVRQVGELIVGTEIAEFFMKDDQICGAVIKQVPALQNIRVALHKTGFKGLVHDQVVISSTGEFIFNFEGTEKVYSASETFTIGGENGFNIGESRVKLYPKDPTKDRLIIKSIQRGYGSYKKNPAYRGLLEISMQDKGFVIVNEVDFEEYLYAVVPSEMPSSYGVITSKVQAVTARSYAYNQIYGNRFHRYGAHVDDSTACQVYNNIPENDTSIQAVNDTKKQGIMFDNKVVSANFFSTSCGFTANSGEVWPNGRTKRFPNITPEYLSAGPQFAEGEYGNLTKEEVFYSFLKSDINSYDSKFPWYRWNVLMSREEIEKSINYNLKEVYESSPYTVRTLDEQNIFRSSYIDGVGSLIDLKVYRRGEGGNIMEMVIEGSERTVKLSSEYIIRKVIRPVQYDAEKEPLLLHLANDTVRKGHINGETYAMPSAFFVMEKKRDVKGNLVSINFFGGGYGHGVGMSQNGAKGMADEGYDYKEILEHFYKGVKVKPIM